MKRLRSSDDLDSYSEKSSSLKDSSLNRSNSRSFYHKSDGVRKGLVSASSPSSRYDRDRSIDDDSRDSPRFVRKRTDHDFDSFDRRKGMGSSGFDRYAGSREGYSGGVGGNGSGISADRAVHRSESFSGSRREFPKGFRSERDRSRREGSVSSWRRFGSGSKDFEEGRGSRSGNDDKMAATRISPKGLKEVKSPTWSRDSSSEQSKMFRGSGDRDEGKGKSWTSKSRSSPSWSKESGSEQQSKSVEVGKRSVDVDATKSVEMEATKSVEVETKSLDVETRSVEVETRSVEMEVKSVQSGGSSSEMEEGELEPEPDSKQEVGNENGKIETGVKNANMDTKVDTGMKEQENEVAKIDKPHKASMPENKAVELSHREENLNKKPGIVDDGLKNRGYKEVEEAEKSEEPQSEHKEGSEKAKDLVDKSLPENGFDLEAKAEGTDLQGSKNEVVEENEEAALNSNIVTQNLAQNMKDKGKSVIVSPARVADVSPWTETDSRGGALSSRDREVDMEGPSTHRGFELFGSSPVRKVEKEEQSGGGSKQKDERLVLEPLDLSLSLPNVLLPIGTTKDTTTQARGSQSEARSLQSFSSFRTNSDGFTASMSCSGSQSFFHNPSCSLTHNSLDIDNIEQSVHSRPLFQGIDWQAQAQNQNDSKHKDATSLYQKILMNGNGSLHQGMSNGQAVHGSSKTSNSLERQMSLHKQLSGVQVRNHEDSRSTPSQSIGSQDMVPSYKRAAREKQHSSSSLYRSNSQKEERFSIGGADFVETVISRIVSDPIHVMARKFHEMTAQSASCLKESIREIMLNADRQGQLCAFQTALHNRSDLTLDTLLKSHRSQLEILVALKSGLVEYLKVDSSVSSSDLAEVFSNLRCRNLTCRSPLPVDDCDCKVCSKKTGFCSTCMCLVCSKFDMASNTCSWVGCDVCLHWCHADCALREGYIRNGRSPTDVQGNSTEMQFHCVACDHPSEMFGFVKEVFQNFAKEWTAETLCKELEYVKRIFGASKDARGRRLHEIADQMLAKMANKSNFRQVYSHIMGFLTDSDTSKFVSSEQGKVTVAASVAGPSQDGNWRKSVSIEKGPKLERTASLLPTFPPDLNDKRPIESSLKEPVFDELEGIVRIKQAEAQMFQTRADDARRDAEGLKRIAMAKNEKIEEEYASRIAKLRLAETEELRKQKLQEFQALERAHREYFGMKMRMEADIKDLLLKMEATKRNLAM
ncbi:Protein OBERON 4 [Linum perenne]